MSAARCLIDTSVLVRFFAEDDPLHGVTSAAIAKITAAGCPIFFTPQVARESWSVLTRPEAVGGYGLSPVNALLLLQATHDGFTFAPDTPEIYLRWVELVRDNGVSGRQVHDAYHVAAMLAHGLTLVLTVDERDFKRYPGISVKHPSDV